MSLKLNLNISKMHYISKSTVENKQALQEHSLFLNKIFKLGQLLEQFYSVDKNAQYIA